MELRKHQRSKDILGEIKENTASMKQEQDALKMKQSERTKMGSGTLK